MLVRREEGTGSVSQRSFVDAYFNTAMPTAQCETSKAIPQEFKEAADDFAGAGVRDARR